MVVCRNQIREISAQKKNKPDNPTPYHLYLYWRRSSLHRVSIKGQSRTCLCASASNVVARGLQTRLTEIIMHQWRRERSSAGGLANPQQHHGLDVSSISTRQMR